MNIRIWEENLKAWSARKERMWEPSLGRVVERVYGRKRETDSFKG